MSAVFADAFLYVALLNRRDESHAKAAAFAASLRSPVITTEWVLRKVYGML